MVREFTELQGVMGGVYARAEGQPEEVWKAIYFHYLPIGVEADAPPSKAQLGKAAITWAAVSLADKLDTIAGLFSADEKPTGSRDPYGLRRAAQGVIKILADLPEYRPGISVDPQVLLQEAFGSHHGSADALSLASAFLWERTEHLYEQRGGRPDELRVIRSDKWSVFDTIKQRLDAYKQKRQSENFKAMASLFKRVKNISSGTVDDGTGLVQLKARLTEPAELALVDAMITQQPAFEKAVSDQDFGKMVDLIADLQPAVDRFFKDVLVMADDAALRNARLTLLARLHRVVRQNIGDISEMAPDEVKQA